MRQRAERPRLGVTRRGCRWEPIPQSVVGRAMPRRRKLKLPPRMALPAAELESKLMAMLRGLRECAKLKGVRFVHVGSFGFDSFFHCQPRSLLHFIQLVSGSFDTLEFEVIEVMLDERADLLAPHASS
jgi:hypothetical protein